MKIREVIANNVRERRKVAGFRAQKDLAEAAGLSTTSVGRLEAGMGWVDEKTIQSISTALGCEESDLFTLPVHEAVLVTNVVPAFRAILLGISSLPDDELADWMTFMVSRSTDKPKAKRTNR